MNLRRHVCTAAFLAVFAPLSVFGQLSYWDNSLGNGIWSNTGNGYAANWVGDTNPTSTAVIVLNDGYVTGPQTIDSRNSSKTVAGLIFSGQYSYNVMSTDSASNRHLTFNSASSISGITGGTADHSISLAVRLGTTTAFTSAVSGHTLTFADVMNTNGNDVSFQGIGTTVLAGAVSGGGTLTKLEGGVLTFASSASVSNIVLSGGTILLSAANITATNLHVTANSILDFGTGSASVLNLSSVSIDAGVTLTVKNWTDTVDYFYSTNSPSAGVLSQIVFSGLGPTGWQSVDKQIRPVPEPAAYGAILIIGLFGWAYARRFRGPSAVAG